MGGSARLVIVQNGFGSNDFFANTEYVKFVYKSDFASIIV